jgi:hypothetical protein
MVAAVERDRAERRFNDVRQLSNALLTDIAPKIERLQGATEARQSLLAQSLKYLDSLAQEAEGDLALQAELAAAYEKIGDLQGNLANPISRREASLSSSSRFAIALLGEFEGICSVFIPKAVKLVSNQDYQQNLPNSDCCGHLFRWIIAESGSAGRDSLWDLAAR